MTSKHCSLLFLLFVIKIVKQNVRMSVLTLHLKFLLKVLLKVKILTQTYKLNKFCIVILNNCFSFLRLETRLEYLKKVLDLFISLLMNKIRVKQLAISLRMFMVLLIFMVQQ